MIYYRDEKTVVELKSVGKLLCDLPNTVDKLEEYWRPVSVGVIVVPVADSLQKM